MKHSRVLYWLVVVAWSVNTATAGNDPRAAQLVYEPWAKSCIGPTCFVGSGARGACHPSGGGLFVIIEDKGLGLSAYLATKRPLQGALSIRIDQGDPLLISEPQCVATSCGGRFEIDRDFVERLKRARTIAVEATDASHTKIGISLSLAGFAEAFDGPGTEPKVREEIISREEMQEMMRREEEEKRATECRE
jgi:Invasion associated locus B (IalB) protein